LLLDKAGPANVSLDAETREKDALEAIKICIGNGVDVNGAND
jgi:hypothetical protein